MTMASVFEVLLCSKSTSVYLPIVFDELPHSVYLDACRPARKDVDWVGPKALMNIHVC